MLWMIQNYFRIVLNDVNLMVIDNIEGFRNWLNVNKSKGKSDIFKLIRLTGNEVHLFYVNLLNPIKLKWSVHTNVLSFGLNF